MKSLQGLILYHLQGATCSTAIIGMDGTATISRKRRGTEREKEGGRARERGRETKEMNRGGEREREKETDGEETSWREDKEARHRGVKLMQMMTLSVLQRHNEGGK